jgi:hypothetical protein
MAEGPQVTAFLYCGYTLMLQKNPESESVRDQQQGHDKSRNEVGGSQLPRHEPGVIGLVEGVEEIGRAPEAEDPRDDNAGRTGQRYQREQGEYRRTLQVTDWLGVARFEPGQSAEL